MPVYLGLDFGLQKVGLAFADTPFAEPLTVLVNDARLTMRLVDICNQKRITHLVLGLPEGPLLPKLYTFADHLTQATGLPIIYQDETLTSHDALVKMRQAGKSSQAVRLTEHAVAAAFILQAYLDRTLRREDV